MERFHVGDCLSPANVQNLAFQNHRLRKRVLDLGGNYSRANSRLPYDSWSVRRRANSLTNVDINADHVRLVGIHPVGTAIVNAARVPQCREPRNRSMGVASAEGLHQPTAVYERVQEQGLISSLIIGGMHADNASLEKAENSSMKAEDDLVVLSLSLKKLESLKACMKSLALDLDLKGRFQSHNVADE
ncbi:hypothetical protein Tco_0619931 [Tanacetum coccineum]